MSHLVIYTNLDGTVGYQPCAQIADAVRHVELLRNERGIEIAKIFALDEVKFEIKPYYRVEIPGAARPEAAPVEVPITAVERSLESWPAPVDAPVAAVSSVTAEVAALIATPPPPPPVVASPTAVDDALAELENAEAGVGSRRGLFGR